MNQLSRYVEPHDVDGVYEAVLFDMDGVVTNTASIHAVAWKQLFDQVLRDPRVHVVDPGKTFDAVADYRRYEDAGVGVVAHRPPALGRIRLLDTQPVAARACRTRLVGARKMTLNPCCQRSHQGNPCASARSTVPGYSAMKPCTAGTVRSHPLTRRARSSAAATSGMAQARFTQRRPSLIRGNSAVSFGAGAGVSPVGALRLTP